MIKAKIFDIVQPYSPRSGGVKFYLTAKMRCLAERGEVRRWPMRWSGSGRWIRGKRSGWSGVGGFGRSFRGFGRFGGWWRCTKHWCIDEFPVADSDIPTQKISKNCLFSRVRLTGRIVMYLIKTGFRSGLHNFGCGRRF